jgi:hypothetical protein
MIVFTDPKDAIITVGETYTLCDKLPCSYDFDKCELCPLENNVDTMAWLKDHEFDHVIAEYSPDRHNENMLYMENEALYD